MPNQNSSKFADALVNGILSVSSPVEDREGVFTIPTNELKGLLANMEKPKRPPSSFILYKTENKEKFKEKHGVNLGFMSFFTLASVRALKEFPAVNSMIDGTEMISYNYCDISIAVSGPKGLMVPVIRSAEELNFKGAELEVKRLAERARDGQATGGMSRAE